MESLLILGLGAAGVSLWATAVHPRLNPLRSDDTEARTAGLFLLAMLTGQIVLAALGSLHGEPPGGALSLPDLLAVQTLGYGAAVLVLLGGWRGAPGRLQALGLRRHHGPGALLAAASAWMLFAPLLALAQLANRGLLRLFGVEPGLQRYLQLFVAEAGTASPFVWLAMVVFLPVCEELLMRGALYGGLRRLVRPGIAALLSALVFGLLHDPAAWVPVTLLGLLLAWLYERTGSLLVPCLVHALQNGVTLLLAAGLEKAP